MQKKILAAIIFTKSTSKKRNRQTMRGKMSNNQKILSVFYSKSLLLYSMISQADITYLIGIAIPKNTNTLPIQNIIFQLFKNKKHKKSPFDFDQKGFFILKDEVVYFLITSSIGTPIFPFGSSIFKIAAKVGAISTI